MEKTIHTNFKLIEPITAEEFDEYFYMRWLVLRKPWNQPAGSEVDTHEQESIHGMIVDKNQKAVAICRIQMNDSFTAQVRYMAVDERYRSKGLEKNSQLFRRQSQTTWRQKSIFRC
jgi:hypothetical protein